MKAQIKIMIELKISLVNSLRLFKGNIEDKFSLKKYARKIEPTHSTTENISFINQPGIAFLEKDKVVINQRQIAEALEEPVQAIIEAVKNTLENSDPELASDIVDKGIVLTGGGSLLGELDQVIRDATGLPVSIADDPLCCVVQGTGKCAENLKDLRSVLSSSY